jgi:hypothetical protein
MGLSGLASGIMQSMINHTREIDRNNMELDIPLDEMSLHSKELPREEVVIPRLLPFLIISRQV